MADHDHTPTPKSNVKRTCQAIAKAPAKIVPPNAEPRTTELIGLTEDGRMLLWDTQPVRPINAFDTTPDGRRVVCGHYVINWKGHAITAHLSSMTDGGVKVQFMCSNAEPEVHLRSFIEGKLLGIVVKNQQQEEELLRLLQGLHKRLQQRNDTPDRQRGRI